MQDPTPTTKTVNPISCAAMLVLLAGTSGLIATPYASASTGLFAAQFEAQSPGSDDDDHSDSADDDHDEDHDADDDDDHDEDHDADDDEDHDEDHDADDDDDHDEDHDADDDDDHDEDHDADDDDDSDEDHDADDDDDSDEDHDADDDDDHDEDHDADDDGDSDEDHDADDDDSDDDHDADDDDDSDEDHEGDDDDDADDDDDSEGSGGGGSDGSDSDSDDDDDGNDDGDDYTDDDSSSDDGVDGDINDLPDTIRLTGTVRDFQEGRVTGGHQDFERRPSGGFGQYVNMVNDFLGADGKPTMRGTGVKLQSNWKDSQGRSIMGPREYLPTISGDQPGSINPNKAGATTTEHAFDQWFRDTPGVNVSRPLTLTLVRQPGSNVFTFDDREDPIYANLGGFFPINDALFGNSAGGDKNFHFTFELQTEFIFEAGEGMNFKFTGDDDVWVYIDDHLVVDIGGVHGAVSQTIDLDRLDWLVDGESYNLTFFFAERHRTQSNFRIETTLQLRTVRLPPTAALYD